MPEIVVFDLDGTILSINSFRLWVAYLVKGSVPELDVGLRWRLRLGALGAVLLRKSGLIDHEILKRRLQRLWQRAATASEGAIEDDFVRRLRHFVRPELSALLAAVAAGEVDAVLATAAAGDYAFALGRALGFRHIVATPTDRAGDAPSTQGVVKRDALRLLLGELGWQGRDIVLLTDHLDDLPLIEISQVVYWFGREEARRTPRLRLTGADLRPAQQAGEILDPRPI